MLNISLSPTKALAVVLSVLLTPIRALRLRYVPLLLVYFAPTTAIIIKELMVMSSAPM
jgi:hypothetical protein